MASRKPLVIVSGVVQQIPAGDTLDAPTTTPDVYSLTNGEAGSVVIGTPVYLQSAGTVKKAKADASGTTQVLGLVYDSSISASTAGTVILQGVLAATTGQWDTAAGTTGGLTAGTVYYLSKDTAGLLTATAPSAAGQFVCRVGQAVSTTEMYVNPQPYIGL